METHLTRETPSEPAAALLQNGKNLAFTAPELSESYRTVTFDQATAGGLVIIPGKSYSQVMVDEARDLAAKQAADKFYPDSKTYRSEDGNYYRGHIDGWNAAVRFLREGK